VLEAASNPMPETSATLAVLGRRVPVGGQGVEQLQRRRSQRGKSQVRIEAARTLAADPDLRLVSEPNPYMRTER
jgi:hypothetical protein